MPMKLTTLVPVTVPFVASTPESSPRQVEISLPMAKKNLKKTVLLDFSVDFFVELANNYF